MSKVIISIGGKVDPSLGRTVNESLTNLNRIVQITNRLNQMVGSLNYGWARGLSQVATSVTQSTLAVIALAKAWDLVAASASRAAVASASGGVAGATAAAGAGAAGGFASKMPGLAALAAASKLGYDNVMALRATADQRVKAAELEDQLIDQRLELARGIGLEANRRFGQRLLSDDELAALNQSVREAMGQPLAQSLNSLSRLLDKLPSMTEDEFKSQADMLDLRAKAAMAGQDMPLLPGSEGSVKRWDPDSYMGQLESINIALEVNAQQHALIDRAYRLEAISAEEYFKRSLANAEQEIALTRKRYDAEAALAAKRKELNYGAVQDSANMFGSFAQMASLYGRKGFAAAKGFGIAQATISMALGIAKALELGWPWSIVGMAAAAASGAAQIATIANTQPPAYEQGGFTGFGDRSEPAGIVHRGEFVMSAPAVQRVGIAELESMNRGAGGGARPMNIAVFDDRTAMNNWMETQEFETRVINIAANNRHRI